MRRTFYFHIMSNVSKTLYIGMTNDLERRIAQHRMKETEGFTKRCNLTMLAHAEDYADPGSAIAREKQLKGWTRARKIELIEENNPNWLDLAAEWFPGERHE